MTRPADNDNLTDLLAGYALENLSPEEVTQLQTSLEAHPELAAQVAKDASELRLVLSFLPYDLPVVEPPAGLKQKILAAAQRTAEIGDETAENNVIPLTQPEASGPSRPVPIQNNPRQKADLRQKNKRRWPTWMMGMSTGIAAVAIAAFGITQVQLHQQTQANSAMRQQLEATNTELLNLRRQFQSSQEVTAFLGEFLGESDTQVRALVGVEPTDAAGLDVPQARLLAQAGNPDIVLLTQDLPQLPPEQIYRLWSVAEGAATPTYCGEFRQDESGTARWRVPDPSCTQTPSQLLITLDSPKDPITSAGPLVLKSEA